MATVTGSSDDMGVAGALMAATVVVLMAFAFAAALHCECSTRGLGLSAAERGEGNP